MVSAVVSSPSSLPGELTLARFASHVGSTFVVLAGDSLVPLTLVEVTTRSPHPADRAGLTGEAFSLIFDGEVSRPLGQRPATVVHRAMGQFRLSIAPFGRQGRGQQYQAVVDRRAPGR